MAFEPQFNEIETKNKRRIDVLKTQTNLNLQTNGEKIEKLLSLKSFASVETINVSNSVLTIDGTVNSCALVMTDEGKIISLNGSSSFSINSNLNQSYQDCEFFCDVDCLGIDNKSMNEQTISFVQKIEIEIFVLEKRKQKYVSSIAPANQKISTFEFNTINKVFVEKFNLNTELELPNSISKVLNLDSFAVVSKTSSNDDMTILNGTLFTTLLYLTNDENPKLKTKTYNNDFVQEILTTGLKKEQSVFGKLCAIKNDFKVQGELNSSKGVLSLDTTLKSEIISQNYESFESVEDAFCVRKELQMEFQSFLSEKIVLNKTFSDKIDGNLVLSDDDQRLDKILVAIPNKVSVQNSMLNENEITFQGVASVDVLYVLDDENRTIKSSQVQIPFETSQKCDELTPNDEITTKAFVKETDARLKKSKEIDVTAEIVITFEVLRKEDDAVMSNLIVGDDRKEQKPSLGIYVVNDIKDVWDASKMLLISPELFEKQNQDITFPITKPTQVVVYRERLT